ncbi:MAG: carboxypeptidase M32 [Thermomicrobiales bacterium]
MTNETYDALLHRLQKINDIEGALALLGWDQQTKMPPAGGAARAERIATLAGIAHEMATSEELGSLIDALGNYETSMPPESDEACLIRIARRQYEKARVIPTSLATEMSRAEALGYAAWTKAKESGDFKAFLPALTNIVDLTKQYIDLVKATNPDVADDYDILLDNFEPMLTAAEVDVVFDRLKEATIPLVGIVSERADLVHDDLIHQTFPVPIQRAFIDTLAATLGVDPASWRIDDTVHPFANPIALEDIRITNHYYEHTIGPVLFGTMHEFGHGLYERQVSPSVARTPLQRGASMAWHESQSRTWENLIGRGRPFWDWATPQLASAFPDQLGDATPDALFQAVNRLGPSPIRIEADELTYNLHIILRYELERDIFAGRVDLADLPEAWNAKISQYLGIPVPNDSVGVLQDVHWGSGLFGYFPTYALGNVVALQVWQRIVRELPNLNAQVSAGEFASLREWLGETIHRHGRKYTPKDLLQRVVGTDTFDPEPLIAYLQGKVHTLYGA